MLHRRAAGGCSRLQQVAGGCRRHSFLRASLLRRPRAPPGTCGGFLSSLLLVFTSGPVLTDAERFKLCFCLFLDGDMTLLAGLCHNSYLSHARSNFFSYTIPWYLAQPPPSPSSQHQSFNQKLSYPLHLLPPPPPCAQQSDTLRAKNPIAIVTSELLQTGRLSRGLQNRAFLPSCQTGLNTVFSVVTQRHTIAIIDIQLRTSSLYIFSWRAAVCSCCTSVHKTSSSTEDVM